MTDSSAWASAAGRAVVVCAAVLLSGMASYAQRPSHRRKFDLFVEGGGSFYTPKSVSGQVGSVVPQVGPVVFRDTATLQDSGRFSAGADFWLTEHDAVQLGYSYASAAVAQSSQAVSPPIGGAGSATAPVRAHLVSLDYLRSFQASPRCRLLLLAGVGRIWRTLHAPGSFVANLGVGAEFAITHRWALRTEYRDYIMPFPTGSSFGGWVHSHAPAIGLVFRF